MTRREIPLDAREIFRALAEEGVDFVVIGGVAVQAHGHTRTTQDLDIVPDPAQENLRRLILVLAKLRARPVGTEPREPQHLKLPSDGVLELDTDFGGLDVHTHPAGAAPYPRLRERALGLEFDGLKLAVASRDDLSAMKRASGRPVDRGDVLALTEPDSGALR